MVIARVEDYEDTWLPCAMGVDNAPPINARSSLDGVYDDQIGVE